eukprot:sb/3474530/
MSVVSCASKDNAFHEVIRSGGTKTSSISVRHSISEEGVLLSEGVYRIKSISEKSEPHVDLAEFLIFSLGCTNEPDGDNCHNNSVEKFETFQHYFKQINLSLMKSFEVLPLHQAQINLFKVVLKSLKLFNTTLNKLI